LRGNELIIISLVFNSLDYPVKDVKNATGPDLKLAGTVKVDVTHRSPYPVYQSEVGAELVPAVVK